jgi:hypothetical protein
MFAFVGTTALYAQTDSLPANQSRAAQRRAGIAADTLARMTFEPINEAKLLRELPTTVFRQPFIPDSKKATWLAAVFPGGGQIYNRKFWKLPIIYGGFLGCAYALSWNSNYYQDYSQAYLDIMDDDPNTNSFMDFLPLNYQVAGKEEWLKTVFKNKKNVFRRQRDMSIFAFVGVYLFSIIDAYVDAELSTFDISPDISLQITPASHSDRYTRSRSYGLQCSLIF